MTNCKDGCNPHEYSLHGPQVEPAAGLWAYCAKLCIVPIEKLTKLTDDPHNPHFFPPYPTDDATIKEEFAELVELVKHRDDPCFLRAKTDCPKAPGICEFHKGELPKERCRRPISRLWNFCLYPPGAVLVNRFPGENVIRTGRGLARAVESETPGLYHRHIADFLMRTRNWSPPRQALVWAALDVAIASALQVAWYYKWVATGREKDHLGCTAFRERPCEYFVREQPNAPFNVLFDKPDELNPVPALCPQPSPGTPRHPAYPSGHSTYSAAASEILKYFFGSEPTPDFLGHGGTTLDVEFDNLADNIGLGRMWAGVHWRSDHTAGQRLGRTVACLVLGQLRSMYMVDTKNWKVSPFELCPPEPPMPPDPCSGKEPHCDDTKPPKRSDLCAAIDDVVAKCGKPHDTEPPHEPCKPKTTAHWTARVDAYRGPQQGGDPH